MYLHEEPPVYVVKESNALLEKLVIDKKGRKKSRRILALILKCYYYISADFAEKIAPMIGINSCELLEMLEKMRKIRQKKDDKIYFMKENIYQQFYRCHIYEKRLSYVNECTTSYNKLEYRLKKARKRLEKMRDRIIHIRTDATNSQIACVIGITKGTVDASLCRLKTKWKELSKKADLN
jgi:hypothetical protein